MDLGKDGTYWAGWIPIFSGLLLFVVSFSVIFHGQFTNATKFLFRKNDNKKNTSEFSDLHAFVSKLDKNSYEKVIEVVQYPEQMDECIQWKKQAKWMKKCKVNVEAEFPDKIKEVDEIMKKLEENNRLQYFRFFNDLVKKR